MTGPEHAPIVAFEAVTRVFGQKKAVDNLSFSIPKGEIVGIIGHSGAGKTTLLRCLAGLERPDEGRVLIEGNDIAHLPEKDLLPLRRRIGLVFQHFNLLSSKTVIENVALPLKIAGIGKEQRLKRARELLDIVHLADHERAYPAQLSGGQKQRVGIARALAADPAILLCDEATSALDPETTRSILELLRAINTDLGLTIILITHEMSVIRSLAQHVLVLHGGKIVEEGKVADIFARPQTETTRRLLQEIRPQLPPAIINALSPTPHRHPHEPDYVIIQVDMSDGLIRQPFIAELKSRFGVTPILLEGGISHIGTMPVGTLFLAFPAEQKQQAEEAIQHYPIDHTESLGYVTLSY